MTHDTQLAHSEPTSVAAERQQGDRPSVVVHGHHPLMPETLRRTERSEGESGAGAKPRTGRMFTRGAARSQARTEPAGFVAEPVS
jgi:hypothetical protein